MEDEFETRHQTVFSAQQNGDMASIARRFQVIFDQIVHGLAQQTLHFSFGEFSPTAGAFQVDIQIASQIGQWAGERALRSGGTGRPSSWADRRTRMVSRWVIAMTW